MLHSSFGQKRNTLLDFNTLVQMTGKSQILFSFLASNEMSSIAMKVKVDLLFATPRNSLGQNTGVGSLSLLQGIFPTQGSNPGPHIAGGFFTS